MLRIPAFDSQLPRELVKMQSPGSSRRSLHILGSTPGDLQLDYEVHSQKYCWRVSRKTASLPASRDHSLWSLGGTRLWETPKV